MGAFRFLGASEPGTLPVSCSTSVAATRTSLTTWTITTDPMNLLDQDGLPSTGGDVAQLDQALKGGGEVFAGNFHMPFAMTVTCLANCQPQ